MIGEREAACPKRMVHGPCGGVRHDGDCELDDRRCPFVDRALVRWSGPAADPAGAHAAAPGRVIVDLRVEPVDRQSIAQVAAVLRDGGQHHVLLGHHGGAAVNFPPSFLAGAALEEGLVPWVTLACRDRDRVALASELAALRELAVPGVHCVTGDAHGPSVPALVSPVFDLDCFGLLQLAREYGLPASVAANPLAPPVALRPARLAEKVRAGAGACFVNHTNPVAQTASFVAAARAAGADIPFTVCVPVITDAFTVGVLERFPGVDLRPDDITAVLGADDPVATGIDVAVRRAREVLAIDGVDGVNLSGPACGGPPVDSARIMARVAAALRGS